MAERGKALVSSPRKLSLTRERASVSFILDERDDGRVQKQEQGLRQGAKPVEVYGFVGAISTIVAFVVFVIWAYFPEAWLHSLGITYYPDRYWAIVIPAFVIVTVVFVVFAYVSLNHLATPPADSLTTLFDNYTRRPASFPMSSFTDEQLIHPIADLPIDQVNQIMFERM